MTYHGLASALVTHLPQRAVASVRSVSVAATFWAVCWRTRRLGRRTCCPPRHLLLMLTPPPLLWTSTVRSQSDSSTPAWAWSPLPWLWWVRLPRNFPLRLVGLEQPLFCWPPWPPCCWPPRLPRHQASPHRRSRPIRCQTMSAIAHPRRNRVRQTVD